MSPSPKRARSGPKIHRDSDFPVLKNNLLFRAIKGESVEKTPVWIMRQAGRYLPDASIIFSDILVVPQAMGLEVEMLPGKGPSFPAPLKTPEDLKRLLPAPVDVDASLSYVYDAITLTRQRLDGRVPLFGFAGAPWTLMAYMVEGGGSKNLSKAKSWLLNHPKESHELLQRITDVLVAFLIGQVKAGAQILQVFESSGGDLSPGDFVKFSLPYLKQIAVKVKKSLKDIDLDVPMCVFARGSHYALEDLDKTEYDMVSLDWTMNPRTSRAAVKTKALQGNADPCLLFAPPETIRKTVKEMMAAFGSAKYVANLGHGMLPGTIRLLTTRP
ncbi:hypothetical protein HDV03_002368 [Kappamyces sp. JEL0829]|nr:hypothetical protein HDV03_002368 [Kappamyces sp. JEL0829]